MTVQLATRNADLGDLHRILTEQHARKVDVVAPATSLRSKDGLIVLTGSEPELTAEGVDLNDGAYRPTRLADGQIASRLGIPPSYLHTLREKGRTDLYDSNVNGWLHGKSVHRAAGVEVVHGADERKFLARAFRGDGDEPGVLRALLSDRFGIVDNLDVLMAALDGIKAAGVDVQIDGADLSDSRMYVRVVAPQIKAYAPQILKDYRSPFGGGIERIRQLAQREGHGYAEGEEPIVFAGFVISNSEVGGGAFSLTPRLLIQLCGNGLTIGGDALRTVHLGSKMDEGLIRWSDATQRKALELVTAKTADAVKTFLDVEYVQAKLDAIAEKSATPVGDAPAVVKAVSQKLSYTEEQQKTILQHFIAGGQLTAGGVMQAVTSAAQTVVDADVAADMEADALRVLELAAVAARA